MSTSPLPAPTEPCDVCAKQVTEEFTVEDVLWQKVTGHTPDLDGTYAAGYWCLPCFVSAAAALGDCDFPVTVHCRRQYFAGLEV